MFSFLAPYLCSRSSHLTSVLVRRILPPFLSHVYYPPFFRCISATHLFSIVCCYPSTGSCIGGSPSDAAFADDDYAVANGAIRHSAMPSYEPSYAPSKVPTARHRAHASVDVSTTAAPVRSIAKLHRTPTIDYNSETSSSVGFAHSDRIYPPWARRLTMTFSDSSLDTWESHTDYDWEEGDGIAAATILDRIVSFFNPYAWAPPKRSRRHLQAVDTSTFG